MTKVEKRPTASQHYLSCRLSQLPNLPGVSKLSETEIQYDLIELMQSEESNDTDSDSTIQSDDIVISQYPVKPRKTLMYSCGKDPDLSIDDAFGVKEFDNTEIDEALHYVKKVTLAIKELHDAEQQREELESMCRSYDLSGFVASKTFEDQKRQHDVYLRVLQGIILRLSRVNCGRTRQNLLYHRIYDQLVSKRKSNDDLEKVIHQFKGKYTDTPNSVRIVVGGSNPTNVVLFIGQVLETPRGNGEIIALDIDKKTVDILCPAGALKTSFYNAAKWNPLVSQNNLSEICNYWEKNLKDVVHMNSEDSRKIGEIVVNQVDESEGTDQDVSSDISSDGEFEEDDDLLLVKRGLENGPVVNVNFMNEDRKPIKDGSETDFGNEFFPMLVMQPSLLSRQTVAEDLVKGNYTSFSVDHLKLALAPSGAIPSVVNECWKPSRKQYISSSNSIFLELSALDASLLPSSHLGTTGGIAWSGGVEWLRDKLRETTIIKEQLERDRLILIQKIEQLRAGCTSLSTEIAALRLGMFTRRITHRNHLGSQGIIINTAPASSLHARAAPKASSTFRAAGIGSDLKTDATKFDDKLNVRSSRSKSKGIEDVESTQLITEDPESICVPSLKRPSARSTDANGRSIRTKEEIKGTDLQGKRGRGAQEEEDVNKDDDDPIEEIVEHNPTGSTRKKPKRRRY